MKNGLSLWFGYLKHPVYLKNEKIQWPSFFYLLVIVYLFSLPLAGISGVVVQFLHLQGLPHYLKRISQLKLWEVIFFVPVMEETLFRLLLKPNYRNILFFSFLLLLPVVTNVVKARYSFALLGAVIALLPLSLLLKKGYLKKAQKVFLKYFSLFFYLSCLLFGLGHVTNFHPLTVSVLLLAPLLTLPQLFLGTVLGFVRMKYGIVYSILFHFLINFPPLILLLIK